MSENDKQAEPVAWRINFGNGFHSAWVDGKPSEKVLNHWLKQGRKLDFAYTHPAQPVQADGLRQAALIDLAYINGAKAGWNMCVADDESQFKKLTEGVVECVKVLKNTRPQESAQPVQPALSHVNETPKNEHDSDDVLKRAKLERLSEDDVCLLAAQYLDITPSSSQIYDFASAIIDAMQEKNK